MSRKIIGVTVGTTLPKPDFNQTDSSKGDFIKNKPDFDGLKEQVNTISGLVGDKSVSEQIATAVEGVKADSSNKDAVVLFEAQKGIEAAINKIDFPVDSVNGKTGAVELTASDVGALPASTTIPSIAGLATETYVDGKVGEVNTALSNKVDKVSGKGLSTNDYTTTEKNKLAEIAEGANKTVVDSALSGTSTNPVQNKVVDAAISNLNTLVGDSKVSTQISEAIKNKSDVGHTHTAADVGADASGSAASALSSAKSYTDTKISDLINSAPTTLDTLGEIATAMEENADVVSALETAVGTKANAADLTSHTGNKSNPHGVTAAQISAVPTSRKVNGKALSSDITLSASDVGADASGAANTALDSAKAYTNSKFTELVGDTKVSTQISTAIANKSDVGHTHDDRYYTESEVDSKLSGKSDNGHTHSYLPLSGGDLYNAAAIKLTQYGCRDLTIDGNSLNFDVSKDTGGWAISLANLYDAAKTNTTMLGAFGGPGGLSWLYMGGAYNDPHFKITPSDGNAYFKNTPYVGGDKVALESQLSSKADTSSVTTLQNLVGDKKVSEQISTAIAGKSDSTHTHDDRYYTESEINTKLSGKSDTSHNHDTAYAAKSHGNHVPATETANNAKFLRNDNTWQTVTPANIGAAASSHGTHVSYSTTNPVMDGTASVGSASTVARSDHKHPTDTSRAAASDLTALQSLVGDTKVSTQISNAIASKSDTGHTHNYAGSSSAGGAATSALACTGNSSTATTLKNTRYIDGVSFDGSANVTRYAVCNTAASTAAKTATITSGDFSLITGVRVTVKFVNGISVADPTLSINSSSAKAIKLNDLSLTINDQYPNGAVLDLVYDGSVWQIVGNVVNRGSSTQPVYFSNGKPVATTYTLGKSVPSDAKFTDTTYSAATQSAAGLMSAADKTKLDGIATGANNYTYTLPAATSSALGGVKIGSNITNSSGTISLTKSNVTTALGYTPPTTNTTYSNATTSAAGLMSAADKTKLDGIGAAQIFGIYGVALTFDANGKATLSNANFKANKTVVVCSRRAGSAQNDIFSVNPADGSVTISSTASKSTTINVNIIGINPT